MNEYGTMVELYWQGKLKRWEKNIIQRRWLMNEYGTMVEWYWQGKRKCWEKNIIQRRWWISEWVWSICGRMITTGKNRSTGRKICPSTTLCTTNLTWTDLGLNADSHIDRPETKCLSHGIWQTMFIRYKENKGLLLERPFRYCFTG
jgi:hypothetical protein